MKKVFDVEVQFPNPAIHYVVGQYGNSRLEFIKEVESGQHPKEVRFEVRFYFETEFRILMHFMKNKYGSACEMNDEIGLDTIGIFKGQKSVVLSEFYAAMNMSEDDLTEGDWHEYKRKAEQRKDKEIHEKDRQFVELTLNTQNEESCNILIELFEKDFPKFSRQFMDNCTREPRSSSYCGTYSKFIQRGLYAQFGQIKNEDTIPFLEDELHLYSHNTPGLVGYVKADEKKHTSRCQFYITFNPIDHFDYKTIVFGRVVQGLSDLEKLQEKLLKIDSARVLEKRRPEEERVKTEMHRNQKKKAESSLIVSSNQDIDDAVHSFQQSDNYGGPKKLEFKHFAERIDSAKLQRIKLYEVEAIVIDGSDLSGDFYTEAFTIANFFPKLTRLTLKNIKMESATLAKIISRAQLQSLKFFSFHISHANHPKFFEDIYRITSNFKGIHNLTFKECSLNPEAFEFLGPDQKLFDDCLESLTIANCTLLDEGLKLIINKINACRLTKLSVQDCKLTFESLELLNTSKIFSSVQKLNISDNYEVSRFVQTLSEKSKIRHLKKLTAKNCYLTSECIGAIIRGKNMIFLQSLILDLNCSIFEALVESIALKTIPSSLRHLSLRSCKLNNDSLDRFIKIKNMPNFDLIDLSRNDDINWQEHATHQWFDQVEFWGRIRCLKIDNRSLTDELSKSLKKDYGLRLD